MCFGSYVFSKHPKRTPKSTDNELKTPPSSLKTPTELYLHALTLSRANLLSSLCFCNIRGFRRSPCEKR